MNPVLRALLLSTASKTTGAWQQLGNALTISGVAQRAPIASLTASRVAYIDFGNQQLRAYDFNGVNWALAGSGLTISSSLVANRISLAGLSSTRVASFNIGLQQLRAYDFNGSAWSLTGSAFNLGATFDIDSLIVPLSSNRIAIYNSDGGAIKLSTYQFSGSAWSLVGSQSTIVASGAGNAVAMAALSSSRVVVMDSNDAVRICDFNGSTWSVTTGPITISSANGSMCGLTSTEFAFIDTTNDELRLYEYDGSGINLIGEPLSISIGTQAQLTRLLDDRIAMFDGQNNQLRTYEFK